MKKKSEYEFRLKRVYDEPAAQDGLRFLVDRLWPRGISKEKLHFTEWLKDVAPSPELRKWFDHDPAKWTEFRTRYRHELTNNSSACAPLWDAIQKDNVTLLFAARDMEINHATVLREFLKEKAPNASS